MSRADQTLVAAILFGLLVITGFAGLGTWIGHVQQECVSKVAASPLTSKHEAP